MAANHVTLYAQTLDGLDAKVNIMLAQGYLSVGGVYVSQYGLPILISGSYQGSPTPMQFFQAVEK